MFVFEQRRRTLSIDAHDLLPVSQDACLHARQTMVRGDESLVAQRVLGHARAQEVRVLAMAHYGEQLGVSAQRRDVGGHVSRAAQALLLGADMDDGDRRFRRNPLHPSEDESIEHHVAGNDNNWFGWAARVGIYPMGMIGKGEGDLAPTGDVKFGLDGSFVSK